MLKIVQLELAELNELVARWHRHHKPVVGHRFSIGVAMDGKLVGGVSVGRPVARALNAKEVLEVTRLVSDGTYNACSMLYAAAARVGKALGYKRIQTYILEEELGTTLKAAGWTFDGLTTHTKPWTGTNGKPRRDDQPFGLKQRWIKELQ